ncbi:MAG: deoxynucleoside kinase, partial [Nanoarchaeota archaeon]
MLQIPDNINLGIFGGIGVGKTTTTHALRTPEYKTHLLDHLLLGNFWVPPQIHISEEGISRELFEEYSRDQRAYAFPFQIAQFANRFVRELEMAGKPGVNVIDMPTDADRWGYGEANRENMGELLFKVYAHLFDVVSSQGKGPEALIYLRVPPESIDVPLERIRMRGRPQEQQFLQDPSYLLTLIGFYEKMAAESRKPVITIDATQIQLGTDGSLEGNSVKKAVEYIAQEYRRHFPLRQLTLDEWEAVDHNTAQKAAWSARQQLSGYLQRQQKILTVAGVVGAGKTGLAELLAGELAIGISRELDGKNDQIADDLLDKFLKDKPKYCFDLQKKLTPKRAQARREKHAEGKSFVEDRTPEEDQLVFHRRFQEQGYLTNEQVGELYALAQRTYADMPKSDCMVLILRNPRAARKMILARGRPQEIAAWPEEELRLMSRFYEKSGSGAVIEDFAMRLAGLLGSPSQKP